MSESKLEIKSILKIPADTALYSTEIGTFWINEEGMLYITSKKVDRKDEYYKEFIALLKRLTKDGNKLCCLTDVMHSRQTNKEMREYLLAELPKYIKAMALLSDQPLQGSITNIALRLNWSGFPVYQFPNETEAKEWLKTFL
jgi:hypothetical protein